MGIPDDYRREVLDLLTITWHDGQRSFTIKENKELMDKLGWIAQAY